MCDSVDKCEGRANNPGNNKSCTQIIEVFSC